MTVLCRLPAPVPHHEECRFNKPLKTVAIKPFFVSTKWLQGNLLTLLYRMYQIHFRRPMPRRHPSREEAPSTNTENHWNQAVARVSKTVRAAYVCMASMPYVERLPLGVEASVRRCRRRGSHPMRRVTSLPGGYKIRQRVAGWI